MPRGRAAWREALPPRPKPSFESEAGLSCTHEARGCGRWIFEQFEDTQGIAFGKLQMLLPRNHCGCLRQYVAQDEAGQIEPLQGCGTRQHGFVFRSESQLDPPAVRVGTR